MSVDAVVSRQFANAIPALAYYRDQGLLPSTVVVHLGTNGRFGDPEFDTMMQTIGDGRQVYFLTSHEAPLVASRCERAPRSRCGTARQRAPHRLGHVLELPW